ncbi:MAG: hypothetical protein KF744_05270 [Taibaiella sp.]|nr:hypothetical protein [Taibaiella sp.]
MRASQPVPRVGRRFAPPVSISWLKGCRLLMPKFRREIMRFLLLILSVFIFLACSASKNRKYPMPYLDSRIETERFVDSLRKAGIDTILAYHKKHGYSTRQHFVFWIAKSELQLRNINSMGIFEINNWDMLGFYRNQRIFTFYIDHKDEMRRDINSKTEVVQVNDSVTLLSGLPSHYPYVDIDVFIDTVVGSHHLPFAIESNLDNCSFHFARLIESIIYNLEKSSYWSEAERKLKYYPKRYDPTQEKWQKWELDKISRGEIWDDYYH